MDGVCRMLLLLLLAVTVSCVASLEQDKADPSLPEDTFRRLAAVLYSRGDKEENQLTRKFLYNRNLTCNDGSPAGYYIRRNPSSRRWVIFLEGGWYCFDTVSCEARWLRLRTLMSSSLWPEVKTVGGILSSDRMENPHFAEANHVFLPYCSSDSWAGTARASRDQKFSFLGADIVQEVVRELFSWEQLAAGTELYLAGSSAGGTGVLVNLDPVAKLVNSLGSRMRVRGIVDSGWFLDNDPFSATKQTGAAPSAIIAKAVELWRARVPDSCAQAFPGEEWKCFFGYRIYPTMKSPVFVFQWQYDEAQMRADNVGAPATQAQWNFIHEQGRSLRASLETVSSVFAPSCISHTVLTKRSWTQVKVGGVSLPDALQCWVEAIHPGEREVKEEDSNNSLLLAEKFHRTHVNDYLRPVQADSPQDSFKRLNSNLVKSIDRYQSNSMGHRTKKMRHKPNIVHNRTNKRNKNKRRRNRRKCLYGESLDGKIRCAKEENAERHRMARLEMDEVERSNRDLVRSMEQGGERQRRRRRRKRQRRVSSDQQLSKEARREKRREKRRLKERRKRERQQADSRSRQGDSRSLQGNSKSWQGNSRSRQGDSRSQLGDGRNRQGRRLRSSSTPPTFSFAQLSAHFSRESRRLRTRSIGSLEPQCKLKHVDVCNWPQCNRSCPKLHNPLTGEEMDFLQLLKSFGLNLSSVAAALGIDVAALNNMDKDVLLHLLTSQQTNKN